MRRITAAEVRDYLEVAAIALARMPSTGYYIGFSRTHVFDECVLDPAEAYGWHAAEETRIVPSARDISIMDQVMMWLGLITDVVRRKIVATRMIWSLKRDHPAIPYRKIGDRLGVTGVTAKTWESRAIDSIARALNSDPGRWLARLPGFI